MKNYYFLSLTTIIIKFYEQIVTLVPGSAPRCHIGP